MFNVLQEDLGKDARGGGAHRKAFLLYNCIVIVEKVVMFRDGVKPGEEFVSDVWVDHVVQCDIF